MINSHLGKFKISLCRRYKYLQIGFMCSHEWH